MLNEVGKADIIILDGEGFDILAAIVAHKFRGVTLVLYLKGYFPAEYEEHISRRQGRAIHWFAMRHLIKSCAHIVYKSQWLQERYLTSPQLAVLNDKPSSAIHTGPDPFFHPANIEHSFKPDAETSLCYAGNFGYLGKAQGIILLLDAYSQILKSFPHLRLYICGDGKHRRLLTERVKQLDLGNSVVFTGKVGREELREYYRRSDIFVYPSFLDGGPRTVVEAQACGAPTIVTLGSGAAELVADGCSGIVCQPTVENLVDSIMYLIQNPQIRQTMAIQAVEHVRRNLSWEVTASKFNDVIASLGTRTVKANTP